MQDNRQMYDTGQMYDPNPMYDPRQMYGARPVYDERQMYGIPMYEPPQKQQKQPRPQPPSITGARHEIIKHPQKFVRYKEGAKAMAKTLGLDPAGVKGTVGYPIYTLGMFIREAFGVTHFWVFGT